MQLTDGVDEDPLPMKPKVVEVPADSVPFHEALVTDTLEPLIATVPPQTWVTPWPDARPQRAVQPLIADEPVATVTSPWNPPGHEPMVR